MQDLGQLRLVKASIKAVAFGVLAESLARQVVGTNCDFSGFLTTPRNGKNIVFHIQEFQLVQVS
jgi:primosomal replication protein N